MKLSLGTVFALLALPLAATAAALPGATHGTEEIQPAEQLNINSVPQNGNLVNTTTDVQELAARSPMNCTIHLQWTTNWPAAAYRRYRVEAWADQGDWIQSPFEMLDWWCYFFRRYTTETGRYGGRVSRWCLDNPQCKIDDENHAFAELSTFEGAHGHWIYTSIHQEVANAWRERMMYKCDVHSSF
ncbi:hypothetical protein QBC37DRAFT_385379 [Rhypophila decipiens]|uniref:Uncharacterized protein n=1 Tax=Rhypophila decipiens TaxID=261697 RepID=A0AAN7BAF9_9PEZI|nr:hypothetical protein QBC37DRAFT_385379 [Rhypophila decipiens]